MPRSPERDRMDQIVRLTELFKVERAVHLIVTTLALMMLLASAAVLIYRDQAGITELTALFGSSGLITYSASRLLHMWDQALRILAATDDAGGDA